MPFDGTRLDDVTKLLIEGRNAIERRGWWRGCREIAAGSVCLVLAVRYPASGGPECSVAEAAEDRLMRAVGAASYFEAAAWNDAAERTKDEVLAAFDRAIANG